MRNAYNRTPEWARLSRTNFFRIEDEPGRITISQRPVKFWLYVFWLCLALTISLMAFAGGAVGLIIAIPALIVAFAVSKALREYGRYAYRVAILPDRFEFYGPLGGQRQVFARDGMQQVTVHQNGPFNGHRFIADTGWATAFPLIGKPTEVMLRNNLLIVAVNQPIAYDDAPPLAA